MIPRWVTILVLAVAAGGCGYSMIEGGQLQQDAFDDILVRTATATGGHYPPDLEARVADTEEVPELVRKMILEEWTEEEVRDYQTAMEVLGLWPSQRDLLADYMRMAESQFAGWYSPRDKTLYIVAESPRPSVTLQIASTLLARDLEKEFVLSHELVHAIQHQEHPELMAVRIDLRDHDDLAIALSAALEGHALVYGMLSAFGPGALVPADEFSNAIEKDLESNAKALEADLPLVLRKTLGFPYARGYRLAFDERRALLNDPPVSTEQVLHPERRREPFVHIDPAALAAGIEAECRIVGNNQLGELVISILLEERDRDAPPSASDGWDGDRYVVAECDDDSELLWISLWDTEQDAVEFAEQITVGLPGRQRVERRGREVMVLTDGAEPWTDAARTAPRRRISSFDQYLEGIRPGRPSPSD